MNKRAVVLYLSIILGLLLIVTGWYAASFLTLEAASTSFNGDRAYADVQTQVDIVTGKQIGRAHV